MKTTHNPQPALRSTLILSFIAALSLPALHGADASPGLGDRSPADKYDVSHSEQGNFGLSGGGGAGFGSGLDREFGTGHGGGTSLFGEECPADWDGDGYLTSVDVAHYFNDYYEDMNNGTILADFNVDLITNSSDAVQFINAWFVGCW